MRIGEDKRCYCNILGDVNVLTDVEIGYMFYLYNKYLAWSWTYSQALARVSATVSLQRLMVVTRLLIVVRNINSLLMLDVIAHGVA